MVFAVSAVDVWNIALAELGVPTVNSTSDTTPQATKINAVWTNFRRKFLTCARWRGATITKDLSKSSTAPVADAYSNQFFLPADLLQPLSINRQELSPSNDVYKIELSSDKTQRMLLTNESEVELEYIADVVDVGVLDPQTIHAMGIALAAFVASYFGLKASEQRVLEEKAEAEIRKARTVAAKQGTPPVFGNRVLLEADEYGSGNVFPFPLDWP